MGCVQGKCCGHCSKCCCQYQSSSMSPDSAAALADPFRLCEDNRRLRHVLSGTSLCTADVPAAGLCLEYCSLSQRGHYPDSPDRANQDSFCVKTQFQANPNLHFFGVFDGHGQFGGQCAEFVRDKLVEVLSLDPRLLEDPVSAYNSAFVATNSALHENEIDDSMSGTTAITVLVSGDTLFIANVGDSRAVAGVWNGDHVVAEDLSEDQTPFRKDEYERVRQCGARVLSVDQVEGIKDPGIQNWGNEDSDEGDPPRLWVQNGMYPGTAFTRSVGDSTAESIGVIPTPEVKTVKISPNHSFFIVASDGVFEFLSSQAVVDMVSRFVDPRDACSAIAAESYKLWLEHENRTDDITIITVHIKDLCGSDAVATDEAGQTSSKKLVSNKVKAEKYLNPESEACVPMKDNGAELHSSSDFPVEQSPARIAPSQIHSNNQNRQ